jgi:acyl carrier protein
MRPRFTNARGPGTVTVATLSPQQYQGLVGNVSETLATSLGLSPAVAASLTEETRLFGHLPELDSMAVATVLTALEDRFGILIDDEDVTAEMFETVGSLARYIESRSPRG